jgi:hypothetical protein
LTFHLVLIIPVVLVGFFFLWQEEISLFEMIRRPHHRPGATDDAAMSTPLEHA